jgi:hypothetical protein
MATVSECEGALRHLAARLADLDPGLRDRHAVDRTLSCHLSDLEADFSGRIEDGTVVDIVARPDPEAQIKLTIDSDDLMALTLGRMALGSALAAGRLRVDASLFDLLRLRSLL